MCGEDARSTATAVSAMGAPPRAWGGRLGLHRAAVARRSTPTCVGRTAPRLSPGSTVTEHPHVCGEDRAAAVTGFDGDGAPPRVWGGLANVPMGEQRPRSTPTCVGRTLCDLRVYPPWERFCVGRVVVSYGCGCMLMPCERRRMEAVG